MEELQPISWRVWAGKIEKEGRIGPWAALEERLGFVDIRVGPLRRLAPFAGAKGSVRPLAMKFLTALAGKTKRVCRLG